MSRKVERNDVWIAKRLDGHMRDQHRELIRKPGRAWQENATTRQLCSIMRTQNTRISGHFRAGSRFFMESHIRSTPR